VATVIEAVQMRSGTLVRVVVLAMLAGCGRLGFDVDMDARPGPDAGPGPDADLAKVCGPAYQVVSGLTSRYRVVTSLRDWTIAEIDCESDGGHLIVVDSFAEDAWASGQVSGWLGTSDHVTEGTFVHVTGQPLTFTNWQATEPNDSNNIEDCVSHRADLEWNDSFCESGQEYVCECDGLPVATPPTWCDTNTDASCGECGTACTGGTICTAQVCSS